MQQKPAANGARENAVRTVIRLVRCVLNILQRVAKHRDGSLVTQQHGEAVSVTGRTAGEPHFQMLIGRGVGE